MRKAKIASGIIVIFVFFSCESTTNKKNNKDDQDRFNYVQHKKRMIDKNKKEEREESLKNNHQEGYKKKKRKTIKRAPKIKGCTDRAALNYYQQATIDDKSCYYLRLPRTKTNTYTSSSDIGIFRRQANSASNKRCRQDRDRYIKRCNYTHPIVRNFAAQLAGQHPGEFNIAQVCDIYDYYKKNWKYVNDPQIRDNGGKDYYAFASETIQNNLNGDCDDFAILICSSILAIGGEARLNTACDKKGSSCHAWAEVNIGTVDINEINRYLSIRYNIPGLKAQCRHKGRRDGDNKWLNLDWFSTTIGNGKYHPGGKYFDIGYGSTYYVNQEYCYDFSWY